MLLNLLLVTEVLGASAFLGLAAAVEVVVVVASLLVILRTVRAARVSTYAQNTHSNRKVLQQLQATSLFNFKPPKILSLSHPSTLFAFMGKRSLEPPFTRVHLEAPDGGLIGLDIVEPTDEWCCKNPKHIAFPVRSKSTQRPGSNRSAEPDRNQESVDDDALFSDSEEGPAESRCNPAGDHESALPSAREHDRTEQGAPQLTPDVTVLICPGIGGSSNAAYVRAAARACYEHGWRAVVKNWRGCNTELRTPRTWSHGNTEDVEECLLYIKRTYPGTTCFACGFSMGANVLANYMGRTNEKKTHPLHHYVKALCAFSNGFKLDYGYEFLSKPSFQIYHYKLVTFMKKPWQEFIAMNAAGHGDQASVHSPEEIEVLKALVKVRTVKEYDELALKHLYNYTSWEEFFEAESSGYVVDQITRPSLFVNARNDPLFPPQAEKLMQTAVSSNPNLLFVLTEWGGHLGWDTRITPTTAYREYSSAMDEALTTFFSSQLASLHRGASSKGKKKEL